jgi:hypothetical protein
MRFSYVFGVEKAGTNNNSNNNNNAPVSKVREAVGLPLPFDRSLYDA